MSQAIRAFTPAEDLPGVVRRSGGTRTSAVTGTVVPATGASRAWPALDGLGVLLLAALIGALTAPWVAAVAAPAAAAGIAVCLMRSGRTPAHMLLGLRSVDRVTGIPSTARQLLGARLVTADVRSGPDPLRILAGAALAVPSARLDPWAPQSAHGAHGAPLVLVLDDGRRLEVTKPTILGRRPSDPSGAAAVFALTDLSRTLSRNHIVVAPHPDGAQVTDLGSANGTSVAVPGGPLTRVQASVAVVVPVGACVVVGDRVLVVRGPSEVSTP
ncbi:FHA domain-containing protein [Cellulomonas cellasea]|uniref:FHA domain-containing protein n=1 Tax=Cellulomonas cellasea TaxID=43670 RepID=UPI0025A3EBD9|nr:FHA domain-containing protein [Cellulomonas cellasea]MDM8084215.1 FHA domain-containing protein [Cellulomonas cellasea]